MEKKYPLLTLFRYSLYGISFLLFFVGFYLISPSLQPQAQSIPIIPPEVKTIIGVFVIVSGFGSLAAAELIEMILEVSSNIRMAAANSEIIVEDIHYIRTVARYAGSKMTNISRNQE